MVVTAQLPGILKWLLLPNCQFRQVAKGHSSGPTFPPKIAPNAHDIAIVDGHVILSMSFPTSMALLSQPVVGFSFPSLLLH
jgi:hypothetical protein